ncbi:pyocin knob domain-containing protein [Aquamicrobium defluvii]|uniref:Uncharacterized protein n=1 Tax=Aquamicrobium defluvii TaxID=69279 RepID=A0A4R6YE83_9HYPH|nr:pyocin knob domain-containing protein [Aquamicrobium defluvii]TDR34323.1 hypothetical protein DES43_11593 [Aquamicrobium defluvii]
MSGILEYSTTPASNTTINGIGISGSSSIKYGDDAIRQFMADVRSAVTKSSDKAAGTHMATKADHNQLWRVTGNATINLTAAATLTAGWGLWVMADGGTVTIDPASSEQINGAATLTIQDGAAAFVVCTATGFRALPIGTGDMQSATWASQITASLKYAGAIGASEDLDTYTTPGVYVQNQSAGASGGTNYPVANAGMLEVLDGGGATNVQTVQRYTEYSQPPVTWQRMRRNSGNWSAWLNLSEWSAETVSQSEAEAGTSTTRRAWTAQRVAQAIAALTPPPPPPEVGLYTGSARDQTDFPVGHIVGVFENASLNRNQSATVRLPNDPADPALPGYTTSGTGTALAGTWRSRGRVGTGASAGTIFQRVA